MANKSAKSGIKYYALMFTIYATCIIFGMIENAKSVAFPLIKDTFKLSYDFQGYLVSISWYGYVIFCLVAAFVLDRWGPKVGMVSGYTLTFVGCLVTAFVPYFLTVMIALMVVWMGFGFFEVGVNVLATLLFTENTAVYLNLIHFFYGLGAITGPQIASGFVKWFNMGYKGIYLAEGLITFVVLLIVIFTPFSILRKVGTPQSSEPSSCGSIFSLFKRPYVWLCSITLGFMEVIEFGASNWGALYYQDVYGLDVTKEGALFVSMFYILFAASRLLSGFLIEKLGYYVSLFSSLALTIVIYIVGFLCGANGRWVIPFTGYFIGILFPTYMCLLMQIFGDDSARVSSIVIFLSGATNGLMQLVIGYINEYIGNQWGFRCNIIYTLIPIILLYFVRMHAKKMHKEQKAQQEQSAQPASQEQNAQEPSKTVEVEMHPMEEKEVKVEMTPEKETTIAVVQEKSDISPKIVPVEPQNNPSDPTPEEKTTPNAA